MTAMTRPDADDVENATKLLAKAALLDPRISAGDEGTILAWAEVLTAAPTLTLDDLLPAVAAHYAASCERVMPADVLRLARNAKRDRIDRSIGSDTAPQTELSPATAKARKLAIEAAVAKIGREHEPDTRRTFDTAPAQPKAESQATIAAKVARIRAAAPPADMALDDEHLAAKHGITGVVQCGIVSPADDAAGCMLAAGHLGPHHYGQPTSAPRQAGA